MAGVKFDLPALLGSHSPRRTVAVLVAAAFAVKLVGALAFRISFGWRETLAAAARAAIGVPVADHRGRRDWRATRSDFAGAQCRDHSGGDHQLPAGAGRLRPACPAATPGRARDSGRGQRRRCLPACAAAARWRPRGVAGGPRRPAAGAPAGGQRAVARSRDRARRHGYRDGRNRCREFSHLPVGAGLRALGGGATVRVLRVKRRGTVREPESGLVLNADDTVTLAGDADAVDVLARRLARRA